MTSPTTVTRTQSEIVARFREVRERFLDFESEVLAGYLDYDHARPYLTADTTRESWAEAQDDPAQAREAAGAYLEFAFGKARDHRGISAIRSVQKLSGWAWLLGHDDLAEQMRRDENYPRYGVPALVLFATTLDLPVPDDPGLQRMATGQPCTPDCSEGC